MALSERIPTLSFIATVVGLIRLDCWRDDVSMNLHRPHVGTNLRRLPMGQRRYGPRLVSHGVMRMGCLTCLVHSHFGKDFSAVLRFCKYGRMKGSSMPGYENQKSSWS